MDRNDETGFNVIFEQLARLAVEETAAESDGEPVDLGELEEIRALREIVSQTSQPSDVYFSRT